MHRCLALFAIPLAACADHAPDTSALVRDSAGVRIVENTTSQWQDGEAWRLSPEPVVAIGDAGGEGNGEQGKAVAHGAPPASAHDLQHYTAGHTAFKWTSMLI